jgi:hypothetical protein
MADYKNFRFKKADLGIFESKNSDLVVSGLDKGCRIMGLTRGNFSLIDLIYSVLKKVGPADVSCVTWSAGIKDIHNVKWMVDSHLINKFTLITDHSYKTRQKKYVASIEDVFGVENIRTSEIHAKFTLIKNSEYSVTIRTSMNLNANKTCESFEIDEGEEIYKFYNSFIQFVNDNQKPGFISSSRTVNKTLDAFFKTKQENAIKGWSEL